MTDKKSLQIPNYVTVIEYQQTTDGKHCYVAFHPELPTCISQGNSPAEAEENLKEATMLAIEHLVTNNLPIPEPQSLYNISITDENPSTGFEAVSQRSTKHKNMQEIDAPAYSMS